MKIKSVILVIISMALSPFSVIANSVQKEFSPPIMSRIKAVIQDYLGSQLKDVRIEQLTGGYSATSIRLDVAGKSYVLRLIDESEPPDRVNTELYAMKAAADSGIAPAIHWTSSDGYAILMDHISGGTLTIDKSKKPEVIAKVAELLQKVHALPKKPFSSPSFEEHMEKFYWENLHGNADSATSEEALHIIQKGATELQSLGSPSVNTHGDLSPRNILVSDQELYFIDWSEGTYTEPFHDLGFFSILMDYSPDEDTLLLQNYLNRTPTTNEKKRFLIAKKMNFARLVFGGQYISNRLSSSAKDPNGTPCPVEEWSYYAQTFANNNDTLSSQHFRNFALAALKAAHAINTNDERGSCIASLE